MRDLTGLKRPTAQVAWLRASVEDGILAIEQDQVGDNGEDLAVCLILSRTEAKVLFAQFEEWAA